ncbi:YihY/virulence factor BrkB family protein [Lentisphaerota bacterium WC36G]|nr:YihY/virulence factor BrkB family protein [Lentisphaerae bacterium WC36]
MKEDSHKKRFLFKQLRIIILSFRGFVQDNCIMRAGSLTFYSFLSMVPLLALYLAITKGFGIKKFLTEKLQENFSQHPEFIEQIILFAQSALDQSKSGLIAGIGALFLFYTVIKVFSNIEKSFNFIWNIHSERSLIRKVSDYISFLIICPALLALYASLSVYLDNFVIGLSTEKHFLSAFSAPLLFLFLKFTPFLSLWLLFCFIYLFVPNTKVRFMSALIGGFITSLLFVGLQHSYIFLQSTVTKYSAIYGSFSALPLFLMWLEVSWYIVLFGAEVTFANQNVESFEFEPQSEQLSYSSRLIVSLKIFKIILERYVNQQSALSDRELSIKCSMPVRLTREVLFSLTKSDLLIETTVTEENSLRATICYIPAFDFRDITINEFIDKLNKKGEGIELLAKYSHGLKSISKAYEKLFNSANDLEDNIKIIDL